MYKFLSQFKFDPVTGAILVALFGILINTTNSDSPPKTIDAVVDVITDEYKEVAARDGFVSYTPND